MTSIKPPDGRSPAGGIGPATGRNAHPATDAPERAGPSFRETLQGPSEASAKPAAAPTSGAPNADVVGELAHAVRTGALSADQAIERLVERVVGGAARGLSEAQRAELATVLREAVNSDPALRELREALQ
jgi:hypothetical protein